ncbi:MAG: shikimate kinase [Bacillota bacterium]|nr:shikimate kinase [Bacillota bacterium]
MDETDDALLRLFERRMSISGQIASEKRASGLPVESPEREAEILEDISAKAAPAFAPYAAELFRELFGMSKDYQRNFMDKEIYGLIGHPLPHSFSKQVHEALGEYSFSLFDLTPEEMRAFVSARAFNGLLVTRPYKQDVIPMCDHLTSLAKAIGAVNTLYFHEGWLVGHNTDYDGFLYTAQRSGIDFNGKIVLILGTGGTSRTVYKACVDKGAVAVLFASRSAGDGKRVFNYDNLSAIAGQIEIIVNTTPVGTYPENLESVISLKDFPRCEAVVDVVYNPFRTALLLEAESLGLLTANGMPMIVAQAMAAAGRFLGKPGDYMEKTEEILKHLEGSMGNTVLIGMPGCGKTTAGEKLAKLTGRKFVDLDEEIVRETGMSIPELFDEFGETFFRKVETMVARKAGAEHGQIIATGGGIVLSDENYRALKQNGTFIWLTRPVDQLPTEGRPLSSNLSVIEKMAGERYELYRKWADFIISSDEFMNY